MSEVSASHYCCPTYPTLPPSADAGSGTGHVEDFFEMSARFGADGVITATEARVLRFMGDLVKSQIMASDLPWAVKDAMCDAIDAQIADAEAAVPREVEGAMCGSPCEGGIERYCNLVREGLERANEQGLCGQEALDFAQDHALGVMAPSHGHDVGGASGTDGAGSGSSADVAELAAEHAEEAANEGSSSASAGGSSSSESASESGGASGSGGAGGEEPDLAEMASDMMSEQYRNSQTDEEGNSTSGGRGGGSGNWLIALAKGLAKAQDIFLSTAIEAKDRMVANADYEDRPEGQQGEAKAEFLDAQATYQASIQMFTMLANVTATSLKSIGEGLTAIARKQ